MWIDIFHTWSIWVLIHEFICLLAFGVKYCHPVEERKPLLPCGVTINGSLADQVVALSQSLGSGDDATDLAAAQAKA